MGTQVYFFAFLVIYSIVSFLIFRLVYQTSKLVVDEEFHLRQAENYCQGRFHVWDSKITTFPGLYLISASFLSPFRACSVFTLRLTSLAASIANAYLIFAIRRVAVPTRSDAYLLLESISLATLPPLYFFSHLYYTDVLSVTMVLTLVYFALRDMHNWGAIAAFMAILMRQTNIVWVVFVLGWKLVDVTMDQCLDGRKRRQHGLEDLFSTIRIVLGRPFVILDVLKQSISKFLGYELNILGFLVFLYVNGSIVIGDKSAHVAKVHLPQIFYFTLFFAAFSSSLVLSSLKRVIHFSLKKWPITLLCLALFAAIIRANTIIHPYMLADNRHYTFYIWNRFFARWWFARYLPIPAYYVVLVLLATILFSSKDCGGSSSLGHQTIGASLLWIAASLASIALQQLIEVRYFILPFLVLRLIQSNVRASTRLLTLEVLGNLLINAVTFYVFVKKEFYWSDYRDAQRIIW